MTTRDLAGGDLREPDRFVRAAGALAFAGWLWYAGWALTGAGPVAVAYLPVPLGGVVAVAAVRRLRGLLRDHRAARRFWDLVLAGAVLMTAGYAQSAVSAFRHGDDALAADMPVPAAGGVVLGFLLVAAAVAQVPVRVAGVRERRRMMFDRAIAFVGCATLLWHFGLAPMLLVADPWSPQTLTVVGTAFLVALGGITKVSWLDDAGPVDRTALRLIALVGLTGTGVAVLAAAAGDPGAAPAQAVVLPLAPVLVTLAVHGQWRTALGRRPRPGRRAASPLPYVAIAAVSVSLVAVAVGRPEWPDRITLAGAVVASVLVAVRQFLSAREKERLLAGLRSQEERLQHEAGHDALTGLANRARFRTALGAALAGSPVTTVLLVDLDDFKTVNDSLGHDVGDELLVALARVLRDRGGEGALPVRIGGDEFAVLLPGTAAGEPVARRILDALAEPLGEHRLLVQASIGLATAARHAPVETVLREADIAMYAAKQRGKAGLVRYRPGMAEPVVAHMRLGGELRQALDNDEFHVVYQPVVELATGRVIGVEALVRWCHPARGTVPPVEFVPAAERTGLIVPLGRFVLRETCRQAAAWLAEFGPGALQKPGVNVSARQLQDPDFVTDVLAALADSGLPADRLVLELTESAALRGTQISKTLYELDGLGIKLALDDFGTGESSLSLLRAFPAAIVKLDKSFVDGLDADDPDPAARDAREAVARAVIQLAAALRLDAVAEGIENAAQAERVRELGYTLGQGYHLARPMTAGQLTELLRAQAPAAPEPAAAAAARTA